MADAAIDLQATDLFGMATAFKVSTSTISDPTTNVANNDEDGNVSCERNIVDITNYSQSAGYCGGAFGANISTGGLNSIGDVIVGGGLGSIAYTGLTINMTAGDYCTVDLEGHQHTAKEHSGLLSYSISGAGSVLTNLGLNIWDSFGIPETATDEFFGITCTNASPTSATLTASITHTDQIAADGTHLVGQNTLGRVELSVDFSGVPDGFTIASIEGELQALGGDCAGFKVDSVDLNDSNSDFDTFGFTAHVHLPLS